jgi:hypothetical protein
VPYLLRAATRSERLASWWKVAARRYAEGRGVHIEVRIRKDLAHIKTLAAIKMAN